MKKILLIIFILPCIMLTALADDTSGEDSMPEGDLIYKDMPPNPTKNRMPTNSFVVCYHESGNIELILPKNAETAMVNIFQNGVLIHSSAGAARDMPVPIRESVQVSEPPRGA